ncbi:MAG TPA: hypothetical protein VNF91_09645, partial [Candidatus Acidoferrum sp.]|nr:hypothetical protein [Candidatus Acidoferrum sp.]
MSNLKFGLTNWLMAGAVLKNGTGGGAPALIETAPYVMANLLYSDRYTLWKTSVLTTPTQYLVDFDLGATRAINCAAAMGFRPQSGGGLFVDVSYQTGAYNPAGSWTFLGSLTGLVVNLRDDAVEFGSVNARSVRFTISPGFANTVFTLGKFFVGTLTDLGAQHSPGAQYI